MDKDELRKAISHVKSEDEQEHEHNIENMIQGDDYKLPWENKYATVATTVASLFFQGNL